MTDIPTDVLAGLKRQGPRLIFTQAVQMRVERLRRGDDFMRYVADRTLEVAEAMLDDPPVAHRMIGRRLLAQSRKALSHVLHTAAAFRLTGREVFAESCRREMLAAAALADWNPSHFLDTAEMAAALAFGCDWLGEWLPDDDHKTIARALIDKALRPALASEHRWVRSENNWNQVCNASMALAALTVAETDAQLARATLQRSIDGVPYAMAPYLPDGAYPEGPMYWDYGTTFNAILISALDSALGNTFGLDEHPGFRRTLDYRLMVTAPDGLYYAYSDCKKREMPGEAMAWFVSHYGQPGLAGRVIDEIRTHYDKADMARRKIWRFWPLLLSWYDGRREAATDLPLCRIYDGKMPIGLLRGDASDEALWLGFKGGDTAAGHSQMDHGSFCVVAGGERWIHDLGSDDYTKLEEIGGLWQPPRRFEFFRYATWGHSMLRIGENNLSPEGNRAEITHVHASPGRAAAIVELDEAFSLLAGGVRRGFALLDGRCVLVQDEVIDPTDEIIWQAVVGDKVELQGSRAVLLNGAKRFVVEILTPADARFELTDARADHDLEDPNEGCARLQLRLAARPGKTTLAVRMWLDNGATPPECDLAPLADWPA